MTPTGSAKTHDPDPASDESVKKHFLIHHSPDSAKTHYPGSLATDSVKKALSWKPDYWQCEIKALTRKSAADSVKNALHKSVIN